MSGFHPGDPGSNPGVGSFAKRALKYTSFLLIFSPGGAPEDVAHRDRAKGEAGSGAGHDDARILQRNHSAAGHGHGQ